MSNLYRSRTQPTVAARFTFFPEYASDFIPTIEVQTADGVEECQPLVTEMEFDSVEQVAEICREFGASE